MAHLGVIPTASWYSFQNKNEPEYVCALTNFWNTNVLQCAGLGIMKLSQGYIVLGSYEL
jgi:hypothetical protein